MVIHLYLKRQEELKSAVTHFMYGKPIQAIHHLFIVEAKPCTTKLQQCFFLSLGKNERKKNRERGGDRHSIDPKPPTGFAQTVLGYVYMKT
jgi:hypothetical protein